MTDAAPWRLTFLGKTLEITAHIDSEQSANDLIRAISTMKILLRGADISGPSRGLDIGRIVEHEQEMRTALNDPTGEEAARKLKDLLDKQATRRLGAPHV